MRGGKNMVYKERFSPDLMHPEGQTYTTCCALPYPFPISQ